MRMTSKDTLIAQLQNENTALKKLIKQLQERIATLEKNSSNSSKPPSSDIVKPPQNKPAVDPKTKRNIKRKQVAQQGHKQHLRKPLAPELIDEIVKLELTACPDFLGSVSSDFFSAYLKYKKETETLFQFCWAHLIREIKFLATLDDTKVYGKRLLKYVKKMFATIHRQSELTEIGFKRLMNRHKKSIQKTVQRFVPEHKKASAIAERFEKHGESYFFFIETPTMAPTNNDAEREIRTLMMDRLVTQGVRSGSGNEWHERFWTTVATCRRQGRNVMSFLREAIFNLLHGLPPPSLIPTLTIK